MYYAMIWIPKRNSLVGVLSDNEARNLFQKIVVGLTKTPEIQATMEEIIKECAGLPIAITTVANALKNQENVNVWKDASNS
jgi:disease resistance protein RPS2